jgi:hypothetical protein
MVLNIRNKINAIKEKLKNKKPVGRGKHEALETEHQALNAVYQNLVSESNNLINSVEDAKKDHEELTRLRAELARRNGTGGNNPQPTDDNLVHDLEAENYLLNEVNKALAKEKAELEKVIASLDTDKQQQKKEFEKQLTQSQRSIENIEHQLVECCSKCLDEEGEAKEIDKAKREIFQLCERLGVELSPQLREDIEKASTYKNLLSDLIKIHDAKMIEINQEGSEEETKTTIGQTETSDSKSETNSGVKYFLWITGILALISFVLFIIRRGRLRSAKKPGKKQK